MALSYDPTTHAAPSFLPCLFIYLFMVLKIISPTHLQISKADDRLLFCCILINLRVVTETYDKASVNVS